MPKSIEQMLADLSFQPLAMAPTAVDGLPAIMEDLADMEELAVGPMVSDEDYWSHPLAGDFRPYRVTSGRLVIPVQGMLMNREVGGATEKATDYDYLLRTARRAAVDDAVKEVVLYINSPGGMVRGLAETTQALKELAAVKPVHVVAEDAMSAAYWLASVGKTITMTPSGHAGSIGVIAVHFSFQRALENIGVKPTLLYAGKQKADGSALRDLSDEERARLQAGIERHYADFINAVSANRDIPEEVIRSWESAHFSAEEAQMLGLVDRVESVYRAFTTQGGMTMPTENEIVAKACAEERNRIRAIVESEEAKAGRMEAALALALSSDMGVDAARQVLAKLPASEETKEEQKAVRSQFEEYMEQMHGEPVPVDADEEAGEQASATGAEFLKAAFRQATGRAA